MAYAKGETNRVPMALLYSWQAHKHRVLPEAGGLRQQPARLLLTMDECYAVWQAFTSHKGVKAGGLTDWMKSNPELARVYRKWR